MIANRWRSSGAICRSSPRTRCAETFASVASRWAPHQRSSVRVALGFESNSAFSVSINAVASTRARKLPGHSSAKAADGKIIATMVRDIQFSSFITFPVYHILRCPAALTEGEQPGCSPAFTLHADIRRPADDVVKCQKWTHCDTKSRTCNRSVTVLDGLRTSFRHDTCLSGKRSVRPVERRCDPDLAT